MNLQTSISYSIAILCLCAFADNSFANEHSIPPQNSSKKEQLDIQKSDKRNISQTRFILFLPAIEPKNTFEDHRGIGIDVYEASLLGDIALKAEIGGGENLGNKRRSLMRYERGTTFEGRYTRPLRPIASFGIKGKF